VKLPRDLSGPDLAKALQGLGYRVTRQTGSHMRLTSTERGQHHVTVPAHGVLRIGTLASVLADVAEQFGITREELDTTTSPSCTASRSMKPASSVPPGPAMHTGYSA